jgi:transposase InsO family protein
MADDGIITTRAKLAEYHKHCRITPEGQKYIDRARTGVPWRQVKSSGTNVPNEFPSEKMGAFISDESHTVELEFAYIFEHSRKVREYYAQPPAIRIHCRGPKGKLVPKSITPDFLNLEVDRAVLIETKEKHQLLALQKKYPSLYKEKDGRWTCPAASREAQKLGLVYEIHTSDELNANFSRWAEFLRPHFARRLEVSCEKSRLAHQTAEKHPIIALADLRTALTGQVSVDELNALIAYKILHVDWNAAPPTEPESVYVFPDHESLEAFTASKARYPIRDFLVEIRPGRRIEWNGAVRQILNVGEDVITLDQDVSVPRRTFEHLVRIGVIGGSPTSDGDVPSDEEKGIEYRIDRAELNRASDLVEKIQAYKEGEIRRPKEYPERTWSSLIGKFDEAVRKFGNGLLGVVRKKSSGNPHPNGSLDAESRSFAESDAKQRYNKANSPNVWSCYGKYQRACNRINKTRKKKHQRPLIVASYETYRCIVKDQAGEAQTLARFGRRAANRIRHWVWRLRPKTPPHGDRPFQIAHIDHTLIDLQMIGKRYPKRRGKRGKKRYGRNYGRLWWTTMVDSYSRRILAQYVSYDPPSYRSCLMVIRECVRRHQRLPQTFVVDNGVDFRSCFFKFFAADFKIAIKFRPKGQPRYGSVQERAFGTANTQFFHVLFGNTKISKDVRLVVKSHNPLKLAVWNFEALVPALDKWSYDTYDRQSHAALGMSPREAFQDGLLRHGYFPNTLIPYSEKFLYLTSPTTKKGTAKVIQNGPYVVINYIKYFSPLMCSSKVIGTQVEVRYDPFDVSHAWAKIGKEYAECRSEYYSEFSGKSERLIRMAADRINAQNQAHPYARRTVNGAVLAEFLAGIEEKEEFLMQALRDEESRGLRNRLCLAGVDTPAASGVVTSTSHPDASERPPKRKPVKSVPRITEACEIEDDLDAA